MATLEIKDLEKRYPNGVKLLKSYNYYNRVLSEVNLLVKYFDNNYFFKLLTENLFDDIQGVFRSFINRDLKLVYSDLKENPSHHLTVYLEKDYTSLSILKSCIMNIKYQVSGLMRLEETRTLHFKSTFLQFISRKFHGEIQLVYRELSENYKKYFRKQFTFTNNSSTNISLNCINKLDQDYKSYFLNTAHKFFYISEALNFVQDLFILELRRNIHYRIASIFYENHDKMNRILNYFIDDIKKNFIKMTDKNIRAGKDFQFAQNAFLVFLEGERFEMLLRKVIAQSLAALHDQQSRNSIPGEYPT